VITVDSNSIDYIDLAMIRQKSAILQADASRGIACAKKVSTL